MSDDEFEDEPDLDEEDLDEEVVIEEEFDDALLEDEEEVEDPLVDVEGVVIPPVVGLVPVAVEPVVEEEEDDDVVDLDEELHPDDVEEALDVVLRERTVAAGLEGDDEDDEPDEPGGEGGTKIVPRRENEFLCRSCFLVLPRHQLADEKRMICRDCA
jgi:hypothetical protein